MAAFTAYEVIVAPVTPSTASVWASTTAAGIASTGDTPPAVRVTPCASCSGPPMPGVSCSWVTAMLVMASSVTATSTRILSFIPLAEPV